MPWHWGEGEGIGHGHRLILPFPPAALNPSIFPYSPLHPPKYFSRQKKTKYLALPIGTTDRPLFFHSTIHSFISRESIQLKLFGAILRQFSPLPSISRIPFPLLSSHLAIFLHLAPSSPLSMRGKSMRNEINFRLSLS
jgi:hypothetical protein